VAGAKQRRRARARSSHSIRVSSQLAAAAC
jgi:hypothetical protein